MSFDDPFLGEIQWVSFNFAPKGWTLCNGQLLPINQNQALFSLLGTTYGGDGRVTFALPDLRGRVPISQGGSFVLGETPGAEAVTLTQAQLPTHSHTSAVSDHRATTNDPGAPAGAVLASGPRAYVGPDGANASFHPQVVSTVGGSQAHTNVQPYLTLTAIICLSGIFPSQN
jgi:microcystin-dependent protein